MKNRSSQQISREAGETAPPWQWRGALERWAVPALAVAAGFLAGTASPSGGFPVGWVAVYVPLFLALDLLLRRAPAGLRSRALWAKAFACCMTLGILQAAINGAWVVNTAHVFGGLSLPMAHAANLLGYGSLFGVEAFFFLGLPFLMGRRRPRWGFMLLLCWATALQSYIPRFFAWTYGEFLHSSETLVQISDIIGLEGLNVLVLSLHLVLFGWIREVYAPDHTARRTLIGASAAVALLFMGAYVYGSWRITDIDRATARGRPVNLVGIQPNFTLRDLASNPELTHSDRERSLSALIADTEQALARMREKPGAAGTPTLVVWPESVYPGMYFRDVRTRQAVDRWARGHGIHLVLTSITTSRSRTAGELRTRVFGSAIHVSPDGTPPQIYKKITLIPFGERIPLAGVIPGLREFMKSWIPRIAEFDAGEEYAVFDIAPGVRLAPLICFDAIGETVSRGMARNGANLGVVLANLAWFGRTNVSDVFEFIVRLRAIEARMPFLMLSQNGRSMFFDATGRLASRRLGHYEADALTLQVRVPGTGSFFIRHQSWIHGAYALLLAAVLAWGVVRLRRAGRHG
ncbi:MAG: apolipoprotein N-acyltransferase [SAR324 cluster bacterium]|nr:apolipoprotein N-acyltransferase [SAR324 cluster bacterium]